MFKTVFSFALLAIASTSHAAALYCVADGYTYDIRSVSAVVQQDGSLSVETMINDWVAKPILVKGTLARFEVIKPEPKGHAGTQGTDRVFLVKTNEGKYVLQTLTFCNPYYQEEKCISEEDVIDSSIDRNVWCNEQK